MAMNTMIELLKQKIAKIKENISLRRFSRFKLGEGLEKKGGDSPAEVGAWSTHVLPCVQKSFD